MKPKPKTGINHNLEFLQGEIAQISQRAETTGFEVAACVSSAGTGSFPSQEFGPSKARVQQFRWKDRFVC